MRRPVIPLLVSLSLACVSSASEPAFTTLSIKGLDCDGCAAVMERQLGNISGVTAYVVSRCTAR
jgi:hypothetical protein